MSEPDRTVIVRRRRRMLRSHRPMTGSWKIALADFMTALMALFLVLWLLATASPEELQGVVRYFRTPLLVALSGGDRSSASTSVIPGGGTDPAHSEGEVSRIDLRRETRPAEIMRTFLQVQHRIESIIRRDPDLAELRDQVIFQLSQEGLRIQLIDADQRPMFQLGSDVLAPYMKELLRELAPVLNDLPNWLSISGHTDSLPYANGELGYSNWELSTDRANACRRELVAAGFDAAKLLRITGMGDRMPIPGSKPGDAANRRITLVVHSEAAAEHILKWAKIGLDPVQRHSLRDSDAPPE